MKETARAGMMPGGEPFFYRGNDTACLLLHGLTATPQEMRRLGRFLHDHQFTVQCPLLAGHGTDARDLRATTWHDWYASAHEAWRALEQTCTRVFVAGLSLGGALALHLAANASLHGVVSMATPLVLDAKLLWLARMLKHLMPYRKKGPSDIRDPEALAARVAYEHYPTASLEQLLLLLRQVWHELPEVDSPVLLMPSRRDQTAEPETMPRIYERLGTLDKRMLWLENSGHIIIEDHDRKLVYGTILAFVQKHV